MSTTSITLPGVITAEGVLEVCQPVALPPGPVEVTVAVAATDANRIETVAPEQLLIVDNGRGPSIAGTRITVYDVLDYHRKGHHPSYIADLFRLSSAQIRAAIQYIEGHEEEVWAKYRVLLERDARGNPPEIQAKLDAIHAKCQTLWAERR